MKGKLYNSIKSKKDIEASEIFSSMLEKVDSTGGVQIDGKNLLAGSVYTKHLVAEGITADKIASDAVTADKIKAGAITAGKIHGDAITADMISSGSLNLSKGIKLVNDAGIEILKADSQGNVELNVSKLNIKSIDMEKALQEKATKEELDTLEIDTRNYILNSAERVAFEEQADIATSVQDEGVGRNLLLNSSKLVKDARSYKVSDWYFAEPMVDNEIYTVTVDFKIPELTNKSNLGFYNSGGSYGLAWVPYERTTNRQKLTYTLTGKEVGSNTYFRIYHGTSQHSGVITIYKVKLEKGSTATPYQPAPEDLTHAKEYQLAKPLKQNQNYTLSTETTDEDWLGVWLGKDYFAGYVEGGQLEFRDNRNENLLEGTSGKWKEYSLGTSHYSQFTHEEVKLEVDETYTFTLTLDKISNDDIPISIHLGTGTTSYQKDIGSWRENNIEFNKKIILTHTITESDLGNHKDTALFSWRIRNEQKPTKVKVKKAKLEKGSQATPYISAEDNRDSIIIKSLSNQTVLDTAMLNRGDRRMDWQPAPEDKLSTEDYTGENIVSLIDQTPESIKIQAKDIDISGAVTFNSFNQETRDSINTSISNAANAKGKTDKWSFGNTTEIDGGNIRTGTLVADKITTGSMSGARITAETITTGHMKADSISGNRITTNTLNASKIVANSITAGKIASNAIIADKIHANAVTADKIASKAITAGKIAAGAITIGGLDKAFKDNLDAKATKEDVDNIEVGGRNLAIKSKLRDGYLVSGGGLGTNNSGERSSEYINVSEFNNVAFSYYWVTTRDYKWWGYQFFTEEKVAIGTRTASHLTGTENSTKGISQIIEVPSNAYYIVVSARWLYDECYIKLEKGNKATDWTPAPEDVDASINTIDNKINNAVTTINEEGVTVKDGSFYLEDDISDTKYSIVPSTNLLKDHSFELIPIDVRNNQTFATRNYDRFMKWATVNNPRLYTGRQSRAGGDTDIFGLTAAIVDKQNFLEQEIPINNIDEEMTFSAHLKPLVDFYTEPFFQFTPYGLIPERWEEGYVKLGTETSKDLITDKLLPYGKFTRMATTIKPKDVIPKKYHDLQDINIAVAIRTRHLSPAVIVDGVQAVYGKTPVVYDPETTLFEYLKGVEGSEALHMVAKNASIQNLILENGFPSELVRSGANLNNYRTPGMYYNHSNAQVGTMSNVPVRESFSLLVERHAGVKQTFTTYHPTTLRMYIRNYYNGTWGKWFRVGLT